jgi:hypothetical protein
VVVGDNDMLPIDERQRERSTFVAGAKAMGTRQSGAWDRSVRDGR